MFTDTLYAKDPGFSQDPNHPMLVCITKHMLDLRAISNGMKAGEDMVDAIKNLVLLDPNNILRESSGRRTREFVMLGRVVEKLVNNMNRMGSRSSMPVHHLMGGLVHRDYHATMKSLLLRSARNNSSFKRE